MPIDYSLLRQMVAKQLAAFSVARQTKIKALNARQLLAKKNPYLYRYLGFDTTKDMVDSLVMAWLAASDETSFGNALEEIAVYVCAQAFGGSKSTAEGIDLEFEKDSRRYIVSIKSGPNWGNHDQIKKMTDNFASVTRRLRQNLSVGEIVAVNGCCYGKTPAGGGYQSGGYWKLCGREFWELISGDSKMYTTLFGIVADIAGGNEWVRDQFLVSPTVDKAVQDISQKYGDPDGSLDWDSILEDLHSRSN